MQRRRLLTLLIALPAAAATGDAGPGPRAGRVVYVGAGNRVKLRTRSRTYQVRLAGVSLPGFEPWDAKARSALARLVLGEVLQLGAVREAGDGIADRIARATLGGKDLAAHLVAEGLLRADRRDTVRPDLLELEAEARAAGRGLWGDARSRP